MAVSHHGAAGAKAPRRRAAREVHGEVRGQHQKPGLVECNFQEHPCVEIVTISSLTSAVLIKHEAIFSLFAK